jgi:hypothetical protein
MEIKKGKVTRLVKSQAADSYGKWSFQLEFDNGDKGYYNTKNGDQTFFIHGNVCDYLIEAKTSKTGSTYYVINHPEEQAAKSAAPTQGFQRKQQDPKIQFVSFAMSYCKDLIVAGKVPMADLEKEFNRIYNTMSSKL